MSTSDSDGDGYPDGFQVDEEDTQQSSGGGGPILSLDWGKVYNIPQPLQEFAEAPVAFIVGTLLSYLLGGLENIVEAFLKAIDALVEAFLVIPETAASVMSTAGGAVGTGLLDALAGVLDAFQAAAGAAGPFAPLLGAVALAGTIIAGAYAARFLWTLIVDSLNPL